jgi:anti-sigma factor ChrR (cupin superfamily)
VAAITPTMEDLEARMGPLASRYVDVEALPWRPTPTEGIDMKVLLRDEETGLLTALFRWAPGTSLDLHEHIEIEQSYILSGSLEDDEGVVTAGNFVWRPQGNRHAPWSREGCLLIAFFLKPNRFLAGVAEGQELV